MCEKVSIIILTKNAEENIFDTLTTVFKQRTSFPFEVMVIDDSSTDKTVEIIKKFSKVTLIQIKPEEFGHGKTRNLGASLASGQYLVFLNGDAIPKDEYWLSSLIGNFKNNDKVAGVYSRHLPRENCHLYMKLDLFNGMPPIKMIKQLKNVSKDEINLFINDLIQFSTVSCAIKKRIWEKEPFDERLVLAEDQDWSKKMLEEGYTIIYEPSSMVFHSHNYTPMEFFIYHLKCARMFNYIKGNPRTRKGILYSILFSPFNIFLQIIHQTIYALQRGYKPARVLKEGVITFILRFSGLLGNICGARSKTLK
ncbi:MAG: glycosyltransferase [bacterium]|nr:glycosyltransferase [bacterium]